MYLLHYIYKIRLYLGTDADIPLMVPNEANNDQEDYCRPRPLSEAYLVPPIARPITTLIPKPQITTTSSAIMNKPLAANYSIVPTPTPVIFPSGSTTSVISNGLDLTIQGYMKMHPTGKYFNLILFIDLEYSYIRIFTLN